MSIQVSRTSAPAITVFYPVNSLMHQVSHWALRYPAYDFTLSFAESLHEIRSVLLRTAVTIVDATQQPARATAAFSQAVAVLEADCVAVYTETMHEGLEVFVRARGAPLLLGPLGDAPWEEQLEKMLQSAARIHPHGSLAQDYTRTSGGMPAAWLRKHRLQTPLTTRLLKFFHEGR